MWFTKSEGDHTGRVAIITGGSRGIGLATARAFLGQGARVGICGVNPEHVRKARAGLESLGEVEAVGADVRVISHVQAFVERVIARFGAVEVLVNNAGRASVGRFAEEGFASLDAVVDVNVKGVLYAKRRRGYPGGSRPDSREPPFPLAWATSQSPHLGDGADQPKRRSLCLARDGG